MKELLDMLSFPFMQRALIVGILVSLCASVLGVSLVLKRFSMIGDGLSHIGFGSIAIAAALHIATPLYLSVPIVMAAAFLLLRLGGNGKIKGDAAIGIVSAAALSVGVILVSRTGSSNADLSGYMFGSIFALSEGDVWLSAALTIIVFALFLLLYPKIFAVTFDESFASASGMRVSVYNMVIALLTAVTVVVGMNLMGTLLISALIIFPAVTAMRVCHSFRGVMICAACVSVTAFIAGACASYFFSTPPGASVVLADLLLLGVFTLIGFHRTGN